MTWFSFYPVYRCRSKLFSSSLNKKEPEIASRNMKNLIQNPVSCYAVAGHALQSLEKSHDYFPLNEISMNWMDELGHVGAPLMYTPH